MNYMSLYGDALIIPMSLLCDVVTFPAVTIKILSLIAVRPFGARR